LRRRDIVPVAREAVIEGMRDSVIVLDTQNRIVDLNPVARRLIGRSAAGLIGQPVEQVWPDWGQIEHPGGGAEAGKEVALGKGDGQRIYDVRISPLVDWSGHITSRVVVLRDVTERKRAEAALRERDRRFQALIENSADAVALLDADGTILYESPSVSRILGYSSEELVGRNAFELIHPDDFQHAYSLLAQILQKPGATTTAEVRYRHKDGSWRWIEGVGTNLLAEPGVEAIVVNYRDITERKRGEEAEHLFSGQLAALHEVSLELSLASSLDDLCRLAIELGRSRLGFDRMSIWFIDRNDPKHMLGTFGVDEKGELRDERAQRTRIEPETMWSELLSGKVSLVYRPDEDLFDHGSQIIGPGEKAAAALWDGSDIIGQISIDNFLTGRPIGEHQRQVLVLYARVIGHLSTLKRAEEAIRQQKELYETMLRAQSDLGEGFVLTEGRRIIYANEAFCRMSGYSLDDLTSLPSYLELIVPEEKGLIGERLQRRLGGEKVEEHYESAMLHKSGRRVDVAVSVRPISVEGRSRLVTIIRDITERKRAEEALKESEERYRAVVEQSAEGIFLVDVDTRRFLEANAAFRNMLGYTPDEILRLTSYDVIALDRETIDRTIGRIVTEGQHYVGERRYRRKDGSLVDVSVSATRIFYGGRGVLCASVRDITERKRMEEELLKSRKLESVGILAGGIAHDFNNILTAVLGNISLAKASINGEDKTEISRILTEAEKASLRAKGLTGQLLTFSKGGAPTKKISSIGEIIKDTANFVLRGSNVKCELSMPDGLWLVDADEGQVGQALSNLIINAQQAMPQGGTIRIHGENIAVGTGGVYGPPLQSGRYVKISVEDRGVGIPEEHISKIFDPYFTTKQKGSGLGLAIAYSIIKGHGGYISVKSEVGVGTTFYVYLPASHEEMTIKKEVEEETSVGKGKVLVMDDEEAIGKLVNRILTHAGYKVEFARDGAEAIESYKKASESGKPFDAVIMDLTIPGGMGGKEAIKELLEIDPKVRAIVSSGYFNDPIMTDFKRFGFSGALSKPYRIAELTRIVDEVIGS
jgi:PAS domain S-box-containing protein